MVYVIYTTLFLSAIVILNFKTLKDLIFLKYLEIKKFKDKAKKVLKKPTVILNLSYGVVINGLFGILNTTGLYILGYVGLTCIGLFGIINTADKEE